MQKTTPLRISEYKKYNRFTFVENTVSNLAEVPGAKFMGSHGFVLFY